MYNPINRKQAVHPSINVLALLGPRAMETIERHNSIALIAAHEPTLGPKVGRFKEVRYELKTLIATTKELAFRSAAEIDGLDAVTRGWTSHVQLGTLLDSEEVGITNTRTPEGSLENAESVMDTLGKSELPFAAQALSEIEAKHSTAKAAHAAEQAGRAAVQAKQRELQAVAADLQRELVKLRTVLRITLGKSHRDYQRLRVRNGRAVEAEDESPPETADGSPAGDRASEPSSVS